MQGWQAAEGIKKKRRSESQLEQRTRTIAFEPIERHRYSELVIRLSTTLYSRVSCGFRQVVTILDVINDTFNGLLGAIPCYNTIENWVKKCGLTAYEAASASLQQADYAQIVDESMMIGSEKLLFTLGVPAEHSGRPLNYGDVSILDMAVAGCWSGEGVEARLRTAARKVGHNPLYVISDNASIMNKGVRCAGLNHQHDISHSLGMYLERAYKEEADFKEYVQLMTAPKFKYNMKKVAYLLPPKQRIISRFINLSEWVEWSSKMLEIHHTLQPDEQEVFSFIPANASLIAELSEVVTCTKSIEHICKHNGLSKETAYKCRKEIERYLLCGGTRMIQLGESLVEYLTEEVRLVGVNPAAHNNSSDILESLFGSYKARKSPNKLNGVTPYILFMPIYARLSKDAQGSTFDFKAALKGKRMREIDAWAKDNLSQNLMQLRSSRLRKAG